MKLRELSTHLGLSPTTVSRALAGYPEVSAKTRARVEAAAAQHGYQPDKRARALATGRSFAIGHILSSHHKEELVNPISGDFIGGITERSADFGYSLSLTIVKPDQETTTFRKMKSEGAVDGIVLQLPRKNDSRIALMQEIGMPFVMHGRATGIVAPYPWVDVNNTRAFHRATTFLIDLGHRHIALINGDETVDYAVRRRAGYHTALSAADIAMDTAMMTSGPMTEENGHAAVSMMLKNAVPPTALVVSSITQAIGARRAIQEAGLVMGRDISIVAYDDDLSYLGNRQEVPVFTAVRSSVREAGKTIAEMLIHQIESPQGEIRDRLLEAELVVGTSTGPAPQRA
ncbi:substrate-binding domain-containing protein [Yoonia sp. BS5-3]|uniref:LacI family DNA-binding transcriptional regulator n=1 Tax=Yoonia phaeophyticola TaxID=3137369 RepID=A0ABZ2V750_9RHOB